MKERKNNFFCDEFNLTKYENNIQRTKRLYPELFNMGYTWKTNVGEIKTNEVIIEFSKQGFEVLVNEEAYDMYDKRLGKGDVSIFIRNSDGTRVDQKQ